MVRMAAVAQYYYSLSTSGDNIVPSRLSTSKTFLPGLDVQKKVSISLFRTVNSHLD